MVGLRKSFSIGVVGAGAWGTALAQIAATNGHDTVLFMRDAAQAERMVREGRNERCLPGIPLHPCIHPTTDAAALSKADCLLLATPAQTTRSVLTCLIDVLPRDAPLVLCAKGLERESNLFLSDVVRALLPNASVAALSGPSFAEDVARGLPTAVTLACLDESRAASLATLLSGPTFRVYHRTDLRGVEIGGAVKNVLAIACGIVVGRGLGESARAALLARGFAELLRFAESYGSEAETLFGLSGLGDLVLTATSPRSRNFAFGIEVGRGVAVSQAASGRLAEGALTASVLVAMSRAKSIEMPIAEAVDAVIAGRCSVDEAIDTLLQRPLKSED